MFKFKLFCGDCKRGSDRVLVARPTLCPLCGSDFIAIKELPEVLPPDTIARIRKLSQDGFDHDALCTAFQVDGATLKAILDGEFGDGKLQPKYVSVSDRVAFWIQRQRNKGTTI